MPARGLRLRLVVPPRLGPRRLRALLSWLHALVPAAVLTLAPPGAPVEDDDDTITIEADDVPSGPLSLADLLARSARRR